MKNNRAGNYVRQTSEYSAFIPRPLPPDPALKLDIDLQILNSEADRALSRLDGLGELLPSVDLFIAAYVRKEAVLSSQIEGTQASLIDVFEFEATGEMQKDVDEVVNYVFAMNYGLERLHALPVSLRLIREIHVELMHAVRGQNKAPGDFRTTQNWIGPAGSPISDARFVPPPPNELMRCLGELETFIHQRDRFPPLIHNALVHAQFETIHPFLDGNGRVGRLLITFLLVEAQVMRRPLLYLSYYFKRHRMEYYDRLDAVRLSGDWEAWVAFFLRGVREVAEQAAETARRVLTLQVESRAKLAGSARALQLLEKLYRNPFTTMSEIGKILQISTATASRLVKQLVDAGILEEMTGYARNRRFVYRAYLNLLSDDLQ